MSGPRSAASADRRRVLLIEADPAYRAAMSACARLAGCATTGVQHASQAWRALVHGTFDLIVWGVPRRLDASRAAVVAELRRRADAPIVMVDGGLDKARYDLEAGAEHWLPKPFVPEALVAAVRASLARPASRFPDAGVRIEVYGTTFDGAARELSFAGQSVSFSPAEWMLLHILLAERNRFVRDEDVVRLAAEAGDATPAQVVRSARHIQRTLATMSLPCRLLSRAEWGHCLDFTGIGSPAAGTAAPDPGPQASRRAGSRATSPR